MYLDIMDCLMDIFVISLFLVVFLLLFFRTRKKLKRVCVVVLGDIGRSPRMQYHALSFVNEGYFVEIVAYSGSLPLRKLQDNPNVKLYYLSNPPNLNRLIQVISYVVRTIWQSINLFYVLFLKSNASYLILQNPPAIPSIPICWLYCCIMKVELAIDWHNYTYTILALNAKQKNFIVNLVLFIESFFGNKAKYNFCVTKAMKEDLFNKWKIQAKVLYDRPADQFRPIPIKEKHELLLKLSKIYNIFKGTKENSTAFTELTENGDIVLCNERPGLIISSTSWTDDEDFSILLNALNNYNYECKRNELANFPNLICVITGKGPLKEFYKNIIQMQNWKHVTVITPWLDHEDYPKLIASADLGICLHTSSSGLDLPMKIVDMFGCGVPVCAYKFKCLSELITHGKNSLIFQNVEQLTEQLKAWFNNFPKSEELKQQLVQFKKELRVFQNLRWHENWKNEILCCFDHSNM